MKRVLLVAKPWRGGLAHYLFRALTAEFGEGARWLATTPCGVAETWAYRRDRRGWRQRLLEQIDRDPSDLILFVNFLPEFEALTPSSRHVMWLTDDPRSIVPRLGAFETILLSDPGYLEECRTLLPDKQRLAVLPFACDPELHRPGTSPEGKGMCFIANRDQKRDHHLQVLLNGGRTLHVYGNYFGHSPLFWKHPFAFRPSVSFTEMGKIYRRYSASLNVHAEVVRGGTNMRTFECAAYGIAQLVEYRPELEEYFVPGADFLMYNSADELLEAYDRIVNDSALRQRLVVNARRRVLAEHTYRHRLQNILDLHK